MKTWLKSRIYNKLLKIKITQWFKQISLTEIHMGANLPKVNSFQAVFAEMHQLCALPAPRYPVPVRYNERKWLIRTKACRSCFNYTFF
jgi:hypothetical protein